MHILVSTEINVLLILRGDRVLNICSDHFYERAIDRLMAINYVRMTCSERPEGLRRKYELTNAAHDWLQRMRERDEQAARVAPAVAHPQDAGA